MTIRMSQIRIHRANILEYNPEFGLCGVVGIRNPLIGIERRPARFDPTERDGW
jgi:hypothetical protein